VSGRVTDIFGDSILASHGPRQRGEVGSRGVRRCGGLIYKAKQSAERIRSAHVCGISLSLRASPEKAGQGTERETGQEGE
jgi:hypothetical protein